MIVEKLHSALLIDIFLVLNVGIEIPFVEGRSDDVPAILRQER